MAEREPCTLTVVVFGWCETGIHHRAQLERAVHFFHFLQRFDLEKHGSSFRNT